MLCPLIPQIFVAGLSRIDRGLDEAEKAISNAGSLEMSFLEKNMIWLNAVITIAPMLGFTGTVVGMIAAFDAIKSNKYNSVMIDASHDTFEKNVERTSTVVYEAHKKNI